jgi:hypothetical protein
VVQFERGSQYAHLISASPLRPLSAHYSASTKSAKHARLRFRTSLAARSRRNGFPVQVLKARWSCRDTLPHVNASRLLVGQEHHVDYAPNDRFVLRLHPDRRWIGTHRTPCSGACLPNSHRDHVHGALARSRLPLFLGRVQERRRCCSQLNEM